MSGICFLWCFYYMCLMLRTLIAWLRQVLHKLLCWNFTRLVYFLSARGNNSLLVVQSNIELQKRKDILLMDNKTDTSPVTLSLIFKRTMKGNIIIIPILQIKKLRTCKIRWFQGHTTGNCWKEEKKNWIGAC